MSLNIFLSLTVHGKLMAIQVPKDGWGNLREVILWGKEYTHSSREQVTTYYHTIFIAVA